MASGFSQPGAPEVRLGNMAEGGVAPAIMAIVERGVNRRPARARALGIEVELRMEEGYPPVRIVFDEQVVLVEDGPAESPALRITGHCPIWSRSWWRRYSAACRARSMPAGAPRSGCSPPGGCASRAGSG